MTRTQREIRRLDAIDGAGNKATIIEFQTVEMRRTINGELRALPPSRNQWRLEDGTPVLKKADGTYDALGRVLREIT